MRPSHAIATQEHIDLLVGDLRAWRRVRDERFDRLLPLAWRLAVQPRV